MAATLHGNSIPSLNVQTHGNGEGDKHPVRDHLQSDPDDNEMWAYESQDQDAWTAKAGSDREDVKGRRRHALIRCLIHLPAVAITLGVLPLTFRRLFWGSPSSNTNTVLNALQFAAQVHGSLIIVSISAMLLSIIQHGLNSQRGVPLGFLSSSFQLNSLSYLFSKEFTSLATVNRTNNVPYIAIFLSAFAIALVASPSSAITMIPRLQFWSVTDIYPDTSLHFRAYINANESTLYPDILTADISPSRCSASNATLDSNCPSAGIREFMMNDELWIMSPRQSQPNVNITVTDLGWNKYLVGTDAEVYVGYQSAYTASTLSAFLGKMLNGYHNMLRSISTYEDKSGNTRGPYYSILHDEFVGDESLLPRFDLSFRAAGRDIPTRKPVVEVECAGFPPDARTVTFPHDEMIWPPWSDDQTRNTIWSIPSTQYSNLTTETNAQDPFAPINFTFIDINQFNTSTKPSALAIFSTPQTYFTEGCFPVGGSCNNNFSLYTCTVDARWMNTRAFYDSSSGTGAIYDSSPNPNGPLLSYIYDTGPTVKSLPEIHIDNSWARLLDTPYIDGVLSPSSDHANQTVMQALGTKCMNFNTLLNTTIQGQPISVSSSSPASAAIPRRITNSPQMMLQCLQVSLSIYISDALSRLQLPNSAYLVTEGKVKPIYPSASKSPHPGRIFDVQDLYSPEPEVVGDLSYVTDPTPIAIPNFTAADFADPTRFTEVLMPLTRYGYGYGFQNSKLVIFGTAILLLHVLLCIIHIVWVTSQAFMHGSREHGWETIGQLLVVALTSRVVVDDDVKADRKGKQNGIWKQAVIVHAQAEKGAGVVLRRAGDGRPGDTENGPATVHAVNDKRGERSSEETTLQFRNEI